MTALLVLVILSATAAPAPARAPASVQPGQRFVFGSGVPEAEREWIVQAVERSQRYLREQTGIAPPDFTVFAYSDIPGVMNAYVNWLNIQGPTDYIRERWERGTVAETSFGAIFLYTGSRGWQSFAEWRKLQLIAHEYFHLAQSASMGKDLSYRVYKTPPDQPRASGPTWFVEGSADFVAARVVDASGLSSYAAIRSGIVERAKSSSTALNGLAINARFYSEAAGYALGFLATELLVGETGIASLVQFWEAIGRGVAWQSAFQAAFGRSIDAFYAQFESFRQRGFSP